MYLRLSLLLLLTVLFSCKSYGPIDLPETSSKDSETLMLEVVNDPFEPVNRASFELNKGLYNYIIYPLEKAYVWTVPEGGRRGVQDFFKNVTYPVRLVNNSLQGKWSAAWIDTKRFGINTTEGFLGFTDPAYDKYNLEEENEDLGQTLGSWGWESQAYIYLPFFGSMSERDGLGKIGDSFIDPKSWYFPVSLYDGFNNLSFFHQTLFETLKEQYDPYELSKLFYSVSRKYAVEDYGSNRKKEDTASTQSLRILFTKPKDPDFDQSSVEKAIKPKGFKDELPYNVWLQDKAAPLAIVLPGLGGYRLSDTNLTLAELAYSEGYHVVTFSNTFNWEFVKASPEGSFPGYIVDDIDLQAKVFQGIMTDLEAEYGKKFFQRRSLLGMSMGAWYALNLAAKVKREKRLNVLDNCIAINPPQNLSESLKVLDSLFKKPLEGNSEEQGQKIVRSAIVKALLSLENSLNPSKELPFTDAEASYLIGLSFKLTLREVIALGYYKGRLGEFSSRRQVYKELNKFSYEDYYKHVVLEKLKERGLSMEEVNKACDIKNQKDDLLAVPGLHLILSDNDFLLDDKQLTWFLKAFPRQHTLFKGGGHLGNLSTKELQSVIRKQLRINKGK